MVDVYASSTSPHICGFDDLSSLSHRLYHAPPTPQTTRDSFVIDTTNGTSFFSLLTDTHTASRSPHVYGFDDPCLSHHPRHAPPTTPCHVSSTPQQLGMPLLLDPHIGQTFFVATGLSQIHKRVNAKRESVLVGVVFLVYLLTRH